MLKRQRNIFREVFCKTLRINPKKNSLRQGFTLIELLVVIAIISLLVSILLPSLNQAKELARGAVCSTNLKGIGSAVILYANENDGNLCYGSADWAARHLRWPVAYGAYLDMSDDWTALGEQIGKGGTIYNCPSENELDVLCDYGAHYGLSDKYWGTGVFWYCSPTTTTATMNIANVPLNCFLIGDSVNFVIFSKRQWGFTTDADGDGYEDTGPAGFYNGAEMTRHGEKGSHFLFAGGNVEKVNIEAFVTDSNDMWKVKRGYTD